MTEVHKKYRLTSMEEPTDEMLQASLVSLVELKRLIKTRAYINNKNTNKYECKKIMVSCPYNVFVDIM